MTEPLPAEELEVGRRIGVLADAGAPARDADAIVRVVVGRAPHRRLARLPLALVASVGALALVAVVGLAAIGQAGSRASSAHVGGIPLGEFNLGGTAYGLNVIRNADLSEARLTAKGEARQNGGFRTVGATVYQVDDVDPEKILVMRLIPGERDDAGPIGDYLFLVRGNGLSLLCPYFQVGDPLAPRECDP